MTITKIEEMTLPMLRRVSERTSTTTDLVEAMAQEFNVTEEERSERSANREGQKKFDNRVHWALSWLVGAKLIARLSPESQEGLYEISDRGRELMLDPPSTITFKYLKSRYPDFGRKAANVTPNHPDSWPTLGVRTAAETPGAASAADDVGVKISEPTNLILYGPPGTGKTFSTILEAVRLCGRPVTGDRLEVKRSYDALVEAGQIAFVTFHQSYSYEDFVEGLRPPTGDEDGEDQSSLRLRPRRGIFREISALAEQARKTAGRVGGFDLGRRQVFKMSLGRAGVEDYIFDAAIEGNYVVLGWGGDVDWSDPRYDGDVGYYAILDTWNQVEPGTSGYSGNISQLWRFRSSMREGDLVIVSWGNSHFRAIGEITSSYRYEPTETREYNHRRSVRWLLVPDEPLPVDSIYNKPFTMRSCYPLNDALLKREALARLLPGDAVEKHAGPDQFVLIIDEINRANISKVFGELITLLEPDKRIGAKNELKVKLPYSGDTFGVPFNLHIVGTMNTADRSIALLDTALRRRFAFRELTPDPKFLPEEVNNVPLRAMLDYINERIEYLFDREHQIGHAYFIECQDKEAIDFVMRTKIIPLLTEYFYEDWAKVALVLGDTDGQGGFLCRTVLKAPDGFAAGEATERYRWTVRAEFADDAYEQFR
ncbi:MAG: winged helix-turn-helix domain-containing protein [Rhodopila sp.]|nr:winged helix-turn-helix domain-containing protein [Rhodopila sp.]